MTTTATYTVTVPHKGKDTIAVLLEAGDYDHNNSDITDKHSRHERKGSEEVEVHLVHFGRSISTENALSELDRQGLRPANAAELLAFWGRKPGHAAPVPGDRARPGVARPGRRPPLRLPQQAR
jgi:hypothetical protein